MRRAEFEGGARRGTGRWCRRDFVKACGGVALSQPLLNAGALAAGDIRTDSTPEPKDTLEPFNYEGVRKTGGVLNSQYDAARDLYFNLSDDYILIGFRQRAGLLAPGKSLGGCYGGGPQPTKDYPEEWPRLILSRGDIFNTFGQRLSGMARMARATSDKAILLKATHLMEECAITIEPNGYFYYSRNPIAPHYTYEKTVGAGRHVRIRRPVHGSFAPRRDYRSGHQEPRPDTHEPKSQDPGGTRWMRIRNTRDLSSGLVRKEKRLEFTGELRTGSKVRSLLPHRGRRTLYDVF